MAVSAPVHDEIARESRWQLGVGSGVVALGALVVVAFFSHRSAARAPALSPPLTSEPVALAGTPGSIRTYGSLPELFEGNTGTKVILSELPAGPGLVGVGSLSGLRGEIAIVRGATWLSYPAPGNRMTIEKNPSQSEGAGFVAMAEVARWQSESFDAAVSFERLADVIEERARRLGIDPSRPFPLVIDGSFSAIELNVTNGPALGSAEPTKQRLRETAAKGRLASGEGSIVGFFATAGGERLIHDGQRMHLHVVLPAARLVGHLDSAQIEAGSKLQLPATD